MPRTQREVSATGIYHVILRGINRQDIFLDEGDFARVVEMLGQYRDGIYRVHWEGEEKIVSSQGKYLLYGYCLMTNHLHLLVKSISSKGDYKEAPEGTEDLSFAVKRLASSYAQYFNGKYQRCGHLFQDRFRSEPVTTDAYFLTALRYVHQNPVKAGIVASPNEYAWSSYRDYVHRDGITDCGLALNLLGGDFENFMNVQVNERCLEIKGQDKPTDQEVGAIIQKELEIPAAQIGGLQSEQRDELLKRALRIPCITTRQLARVTGIQANIIWRLG